MKIERITLNWVYEQKTQPFPVGSKILQVFLQKSILSAWILVGDEQAKKEFTIRMFKTYELVPFDGLHTYIGTINASPDPSYISYTHIFRVEKL